MCSAYVEGEGNTPKHVHDDGSYVRLVARNADFPEQRVHKSAVCVQGVLVAALAVQTFRCPLAQRLPPPPRPMISTTLPLRRRTIRTKADAERAVYADLRQIARRLRSRESPGITLATTGLVHEAYLSLQRSHGADYEIEWEAEVSFGLYATAMRNVLVSAAWKRRAEKRGGGEATVPLSEHDVRAGSEHAGVEDWAHLTVDIDAAMERVRRVGERLHRVVELKFFGGLEITEIAAATGTSPATVKRDWEKARALLYAYVSEDAGSPADTAAQEAQ